MGAPQIVPPEIPSNPSIEEPNAGNSRFPLVGVGGHGEPQGLGYHWEMWALSMGGMTPMEVLRAATIDGARIIGIHHDLGSIEAGKLADLVVLDANPLDDIRNTDSVRQVMKNGVLYEAETLREVWPEERSLPPLWWWP